MNVQVITDPSDRLLRASPAPPGAVHDIRAAREHGIVDALTEAQASGAGPTRPTEVFGGTGSQVVADGIGVPAGVAQQALPWNRTAGIPERSVPAWMAGGGFTSRFTEGQRE